MPRRIHVAGVILFLSGWFLTGCGTGKGKPARAVISSSALDPSWEDFSSEAAERRAEAHARYATAVAYDWNEELDSAAEEYYQAGLTDPGNEPLALEVSQRLVQLKKTEKALEILRKATAEPNASGVLFAHLGRLYAVLGKKELAVEANRVAIKKSPRSILGYRFLAQTYLQNRQYDEGLKVLEQAAKQPGADAAFLLGLGELYTAFLRTGSSDAVKARALDTFKRAAAQNPTNALWLQTLADGFAVLGETERAMELYLKLLNHRPPLLGIREKLTELYIRKQDRRHATEQLEAIVRDSPTNPQAYYLLGSILFEDKKFKEAAEHFRKTIVLNPNFEPAYYDLAGAQVNLNQPREALLTLEKAAAKFKESFVSEFYTAMAYTRMKDYTNALNHLTAAEVIARATDTNRLDQSFYYELTELQLNLNRPREALATLEKIREKFQESFSTEFYTALAYTRMKDYTNALSHLTAAEALARAKDTNRLNHIFYFQLGAALERTQKYPEAEQSFRKCLELSPEFSEALNYLGYMWAERGTNLAQAREFIEKAVNLEPKNAAYLDSLGWVLFKLDKPQEALPWLLKSVENAEEPDATLYDHLGDIYSALHQPDKARAAWQKALSLEPNEQIQKKLGPAATSETAPR